MSNLVLGQLQITEPRCTSIPATSPPAASRFYRGNMPYYLVTQTQLLEADNPETAAGKALDIIVQADRLSFSVKFDETTTTIVAVSKPAQNEPSSSKPLLPMPSDEPLVQERLETSIDAGALDVSNQTVVMPAKNRLVWGMALLSACAVCGAFWFGFSS